MNTIYRGKGNRKRQPAIVIRELLWIPLCVSLIFLLGCSKSDPAKLIQFAKSGDVSAFDAEISKSFDPKTWNEGDGQWSDTPLHAAASKGSGPIVRTLLERGIIPKLRLSNGMTAMDIAISRGSTDVVSELLKHGFDANGAVGAVEKGAVPWMTPLTLAAMMGQAGIVKLLLASGADINKVAGEIPNQHPAICFAASAHHPEVVEVLLGSGATAGLDALQAALFSENFNESTDLKTIVLLLKHGAQADFICVSHAREKYGKNLATLLLASVGNPLAQRVLRDTACKDCPIPRNDLVDTVMRLSK